jgi:hypothetical protein
VAVTRFFLRTQRAHFSVFKHVILPVATSAAVLYIGYRSVVPFPAYPVAAGVWLAVGWVVVAGVLGWVARRRGTADVDLAEVTDAA